MTRQFKTIIILLQFNVCQKNFGPATLTLMKEVFVSCNRTVDRTEGQHRGDSELFWWHIRDQYIIREADLMLRLISVNRILLYGFRKTENQWLFSYDYILLDTLVMKLNKCCVLNDND